MVPEGWNTETLGKLSELITSGSRDWAQYYSDSGSKFIRMTNLSREGVQLNLKELKYVDIKSESSDGKRTALNHGDLLVSITAELGKIGWVPKDFGTAYINQHTALVRINPNKADSLFIAYLLSSRRMNKIINKLNDSGAKSGLNLSTVRAIKLDLPPVNEQEKIAQIFSIWDKAITATEKLLTNSQQQKKALMQQLLTGKRRLPGFDSEWKGFKLSDLFSRVTTKNTEHNQNVVTISAQHGLIRQDQFFKKSVASATLDGYFLLQKGQFAYNKSYSSGYPMGAIKRLGRYDQGVVTTLYICFEAKRNADCVPEFFEHYFEAGLLNRGLTQIAHEGGRAHGLLNVKPGDFFGLRVLIPSKEEQSAIEKVLTMADNQVEMHKQKLTSLKNEKKALMQQLLTGKRRVTVEEITPS